ncbi:MAG: CSLREA domain-containing protein [Myxococcaceae bacterium]|nr:CSLREA domain-containing protein [Myxococcaceae bacterium]
MTRTPPAVALALALVASSGSAATLTVTTPTDELNSDGDCSLREAVQAANTDAAVDACPAGSGDDRIVLPAGTYTLSVIGKDDTNVGGDLDVSSNLTLAAAGSGTVTLDGNLTDRVLHVISGTVAVEHLTFVRGALATHPSGEGERGGAIFNQGTLSVRGCTFTGNRAGRGLDGVAGRAGGDGGAIASSGTLAVTDSTFRLNGGGTGGHSTDVFGTTPGGSGGSGGALFSSGTLTVTRSTFTENAGGAGGAAPFFDGPGGLGGAIAVEGGGSTRVIDSTFTANRGGSGLGLGLLNHGGAIAASQSPLVVTGCTFSANEAQLGGGIFIVVSTLTVVNSTFVGNVASLRGGGISSASATTQVSSSTLLGNVGGAVAPQGNGTLEVKSSIVIGNRNAASTGDRDCEVEAGPVTSAGHNVFGASTGCTATTTDVSVATAAASTVVSQALANNGGPTQTLLLPAMSPAVDRGDCTALSGVRLATDQRGRARPPVACDVGAVELDGMARVLVLTTAEPAGSNCPSGGTRLQVGPDDGDGDSVPFDGVLQDGEVEQTRYVCNGAAGARALVTATALGFGDARCADGGTRIDAGLDDDGDGTLDASEVDSTASLCNGATGKVVLVRLTSLAAGHRECAAGGVQLDTGVDDDGDGMLGPAELDDTRSVCNGATGQAGPEGPAGPAGPSGGCQAAPGSGFALLLVLGLALRRPASCPRPTRAHVSRRPETLSSTARTPACEP